MKKYIKLITLSILIASCSTVKKSVIDTKTKESSTVTTDSGIVNKYKNDSAFFSRKDNRETTTIVVTVDSGSHGDITITDSGTVKIIKPGDNKIKTVTIKTKKAATNTNIGETHNETVKIDTTHHAEIKTVNNTTHSKQVTRKHLPLWIWVGGGLGIVGLIFWYVRKKKKAVAGALTNV